MADLAINDKWEKFKIDFKKSYSAEEEPKRFEIFKAKVETIEAHNKEYDAGKVTWKMGINHFADLTDEEFKKTHLGLRRPQDGSDGAA